MEGRSRNALPHKGKALLVVHHNRFYIGGNSGRVAVLCDALQQLKDLKI